MWQLILMAIGSQRTKFLSLVFCTCRGISSCLLFRLLPWDAVCVCRECHFTGINGHTAAVHSPTLWINHFGDFSSLKICQKEGRWPKNPSPGSVLLYPLSAAWTCWLAFLLCKSPPSGMMPKSWTWSQRGRDQVFLKWFPLFVFLLLVSDIQPGNIPFVQLAGKL